MTNLSYGIKQPLIGQTIKRTPNTNSTVYKIIPNLFGDTFSNVFAYQQNIDVRIIVIFLFRHALWYRWG